MHTLENVEFEYLLRVIKSILRDYFWLFFIDIVKYATATVKYLIVFSDEKKMKLRDDFEIFLVLKNWDLRVGFDIKAILCNFEKVRAEIAKSS